MSVRGQRLLECVPNFSEGRRDEVIEEILEAMSAVPGLFVLGNEMDADHHRAVLTLAGTAEAIEEAMVKGSEVAIRLIDLRTHSGIHPRMGALDVCPVIPLDGTSMADAVVTARSIASRLAIELGLPCFLYGHAAEREERRNLENVRQRGFESLRDSIGTDASHAPDRGPRRVHPTAGAVAVGARDFLIAFNVQLDSSDLALARQIAAKIRERDGGLPAVKALGFFLEDRRVAQVSMNLMDYRVTSIEQAYAAVCDAAAAVGLAVKDSEIVGLIPEAALDEAAAQRIRLLDFDAGELYLEARLRQAGAC